MPVLHNRSSKLVIDAAFWQAHKDRIVQGHVFDVFPYDREKRFAPGVSETDLA